jgi:hypothetical protein
MNPARGYVLFLTTECFLHLFAHLYRIVSFRFQSVRYGICLACSLVADFGQRAGMRPLRPSVTAGPRPVERRAMTHPPSQHPGARRRTAGLFRSLVLPALAALAGAGAGALPAQAAESFCPKGASPDPAVIWCDGFEDSDLGPGGTVAENYFDYNDNGGSMVRTTAEHAEGSNAMRVHWAAGQVSAGSMIRTFGRAGVRSQGRSTEDFRDVYWRIYVKLQDGFQGQPDKLTRATSFATSSWAQAMIAHIWEPNGAVLQLDPATGIDSSGHLATTQWNDLANVNWLGITRGPSGFTPGAWQCLEAHVKLNTPGSSDGVFEFWLDGALQARRADLNWVGTWTDYGINAVMFSNYWGAGSPKAQDRYLDAMVVSSKPIGCLGTVIADTTPPDSPTGVRVELQ